MKIATLLVVDDTAENRDMLSRRLERRGYLTETAEDGRSALDIIASQPIDLVLLDVMMPGISGLEVLKEIRNTQSCVELPVIMVTAQNESFDVVEALSIGANDYVTKPIDFAVAVARIDTHLKISEAASKSK
jgi:DNA-binding response OmpR family regulator